MRKFTAMCMGVLLLLAIIPAPMLAQSGTYLVKGSVVDASGVPVIGATVAEVGTSNGTTTDLNGHYQISVASANSILEFSYIGYLTMQLAASSSETLRVALGESTTSMDEVVVIGYGAVKKSDMTGSVAAIKADDMNRGAVTSPQEMLRGKIPGVNITSGSGAPGSGSEIRIRGGASLSAYNDPLIVIDGVPVAREGGVGMSNSLATINPNDIESFTVLKDASATAIYGSRASNGVILITTKKGTGECPRISYNGSFSVKQNHKQLDVMDADTFKNFILTNNANKATDASALFGTANTDWQKLIYRIALTTDHNLSVYGSGFNNRMPYRVSAGYSYDQGTIKQSDNQRTTVDISLAPSFLDKHLTVSVNAKGVYNKANYADGGVVGAAVNFDPTQDPYRRAADGSIDRTIENGYYNWQTDLATLNPLSLLYDQWDTNKSYRALGNIQTNYKVHGFEDLSFNLNLGLDVTNTKGDKGNLPNSIFANRDNGDSGIYKGLGRFENYENFHRNQLLEFYANYQKEAGIHNINVLAGYSWAMNYSSTKMKYFGRVAPTVAGQDYDTVLINNTFPAYRNALVSFYGRLNYSIASRYLFTATMRADGSSRFVDKNRWGYFPSAAFAWNIGEENFAKNSKALSALKLRLGWGVTGQQEFGENYAAWAYAQMSQEPKNQ